MTDLEGRTALITGAAQGLGRAFAEALASAGARVTLCDERESVNDVASALGDDAIGVVADLSKRADIERVVTTAASAFGGIDILVNNAGRWRRTPVTDPWAKALTDWDYVMDTNLRGLVLLSRACVPHLIRRGGDIVNVSTYYVLPARSPGTNSPETDLYNASKWALNGFTQAWALALAPHQVRVNALCMGATDTPMLRGLWPGEPPVKFVQSWMQPADIAKQLIALLAEGVHGRTGENIGAWVGEPVELGPRKLPHRAITG